jgi:hypothetical protein
MRWQPSAALLGGVAVLGAAACDRQIVCPSDFRYGLVVAVEDSATGAPAASGARLVARAGAYADSAEYPPGRPELDAEPLRAAGERAGTYDVAARKAGYRDWVEGGVGVDANECHAEARRLTARLQPE